jgi:hypothetical protein
MIMAEKQALLINSTNKTVSVVKYNDSEDLRNLVGGSIEFAYTWRDTGDVMYVDGEGLHKQPKFGFLFTGRPDQYLAGNAVVVGREREDKSEPNGFTTNPPTINVRSLRSEVIFVDFN